MFRDSTAAERKLCRSRGHARRRGQPAVARFGRQSELHAGQRAGRARVDPAGALRQPVPRLLQLRRSPLDPGRLGQRGLELHRPGRPGRDRAQQRSAQHWNVHERLAGAKRRPDHYHAGRGRGELRRPAMCSTCPSAPPTTSARRADLHLDDGRHAPSAVTFGSNGSNAAATTTASFSTAGFYHFRVTITDPGGLSTTSDVTVGTPPTGVSPVWGSNSITVSWLPVAGAESYNVYRSLTPGGEGATPVASGITGTGWVDTQVTAGNSYYYQVTAVTAGAESLRSFEAAGHQRRHDAAGHRIHGHQQQHPGRSGGRLSRLDRNLQSGRQRGEHGRLFPDRQLEQADRLGDSLGRLDRGPRIPDRVCRRRQHH